MSRNLVLATMVLVLAGAGAWVTSWVPLRGEGDGSEGSERAVSGRELERRSWRRIWLTIAPAAVAVATMLGWGLQEPSVTDELLRPAVVLVALPLGLLWLRALGRATLALRKPRTMPPIATWGLFRPRVVVADRLDEALDPEAMAAALAHERVHVRHRDPLRIWLAQIATDLQWPSPTARQRLRRWLASLELARDEEARRAGTSGADLAAAIVAVAKLGKGAKVSRTDRPRPAVAGLTGAEASLTARIHRLLEPLPSEVAARSVIIPVAVAMSLAAGLLAGVAYGDVLLRALPFIAT